MLNTQTARRWRNLRSILAALAMGLGGIAPALALTLVQNQSFSLTTPQLIRAELHTNVDAVVQLSAPANLSQDLNFTQFDAAMGTLTGATYRLLDSTGTEQVSIVLQGMGNVVATFNTTRSLASAVMPSNLSATNHGWTTPPCLAVSPLACSRSTPFAPGDSPLTGVALNLAGLTGTGSVVFTASLDASPTGLSLADANGQPTVQPNQPPGDCGTVSSTLVSSWSGQVEVTYTYTPSPVPEPSTLAMYGLGGLMLAGGLWRRRQAHTQR